MADFNVDDEDNTLESEVEALRSIYIHELEVDYNGRRPVCVTVHLHPATADNLQKQYVRLSLIMKLSDEYPNALPEIAIRNPRGLSDEEIEKIIHDLYLKAEEQSGSPMLFELIEVAKEHLTLGNTPSCQCAICLYGFTENDIFTKTECYHYFHSHCLARYVRYILQKSEEEKRTSLQWVDHNSTFEVVCPVCRLPISYSDLIKGDFPPPCDEQAEESFSLSSEMKQLQQQMTHLYNKQKSQGGIIDLDVEKKRYLLEISNTPGDANKNTVDQTESFNTKYVGILNDELPRSSSASVQSSFSHLPSIDIGGKFDNSSGNQAASPVLKEKSQIRNYGKHYNIGNRGRRDAVHYGKKDYKRKERDNKRLGKLDESYVSEYMDKDKIIIKAAGQEEQLYCEATQNVEAMKNERDSYNIQECQGDCVNETVDLSYKRTSMYSNQNHPSSSRVNFQSSNSEHSSKHSFRGSRHIDHSKESAHKNNSCAPSYRSYYNSRKPGQNRGGRPSYDAYQRESRAYSSNCISPDKEDSKDSSCKTRTFSTNGKGHENSERAPFSSEERHRSTITMSEHKKDKGENSSVACHLPRKLIGPPPGFAHAQSKVVYGPPVIKPPPGFGQR